jgi:hypothetical protein
MVGAGAGRSHSDATLESVACWPRLSGQSASKRVARKERAPLECNQYFRQHAADPGTAASNNGRRSTHAFPRPSSADQSPATWRRPFALLMRGFSQMQATRLSAWYTRARDGSRRIFLLRWLKAVLFLLWECYPL